MHKIICFKTDFGWINAKEKNNHIISIAFGKLIEIKPSKNLKILKKNIKGYFLRKERIKNFSLEILGSPLQKRIWRELQKIPYGKTRSYGYIAKKINTSPRYIGKVCGQNKHLLIIPCHRVVRSNGMLGGFSGLGGIKLKKRLLDLEQ